MDKNPRAMRWAFAMTTTLAVAACGDRQLPTAIEPPTAERAALSAVPGSSDVVGILRRTEYLPPGLSASDVIGPEGGHLQIGRAGLRVEFAPGAVSRPTRISVTAIGGRFVAYRFQPHGLVFDAPVTLRQNLRKTTAWREPLLAGQLQGSYFEKLLVDASGQYAGTTERRAAKLRDESRFLEFTIEHFSGYMVSTGKMPVQVELEIEIHR
ncbi:MAG TPA: hypothetical protein VFO55_08185 [Gemmatimonadaceae bacterium]|nr:hypothetical protein [Gemmatimonadaceae bacterium]